MRFIIDKFPEDLARRINIYIAATGDNRRDLVVNAVKKYLDELDEKEKRRK